MIYQTPIANGENRDGLGRVYRRDLKGRFMYGTRGGPGSPRNKQMARLRAVVLDVVDVDEVFNLARMLLNRAKRDDVAAARLVFEDALGKPRKSPRRSGCGDEGVPPSDFSSFHGG